MLKLLKSKNGPKLNNGVTETDANQNQAFNKLDDNLFPIK